jgi:hypothetical protein
MTQSLERRVCGVEQVQAGQRRMHFFWRDEDETQDMVRARIRAKIASGAASPNDQFVTFFWWDPADGES